jgi:hypothetical protein
MKPAGINQAKAVIVLLISGVYFGWFTPNDWNALEAPWLK